MRFTNLASSFDKVIGIFRIYRNFHSTYVSYIWKPYDYCIITKGLKSIPCIDLRIELSTDCCQIERVICHVIFGRKILHFGEILKHYEDSTIFSWLMHQSIPSLTIPRATPGDSQVPTARGGVGFSPNFLCPGGSGFWIREIFYSSERKMQQLFDLFQRNRRQLEKQVFLCCFISIFAKIVDVYCIFNNIDRFRSFR